MILFVTNVRWLRVFHLYHGSTRKVTKPGFFIKGSARIVEPPRLEYKGFKYKYNIKGDVCRYWVVRSYKLMSYIDHSLLILRSSAGFMIKKRQDPRSKFLNGPISRAIKRRKLSALHRVVL